MAELVAAAQADGLAVGGEGGLLHQLTKIVLEASLAGEMDAHLGYAKHDPAGRDSGNSRNGKRSKTVLTKAGPVTIDVPQDRDASFEPQIVKKSQRRLDGVDEIVLSLSAKGLTTGEISAHLAEVLARRCSKTPSPPPPDPPLDDQSRVGPRGRDGRVHHRPARGRLVFTMVALVAPSTTAWAPRPSGSASASPPTPLGMRHAFDADHISAIDNTTRKLLNDGQRPLSVGF